MPEVKAEKDAAISINNPEFHISDKRFYRLAQGVGWSVVILFWSSNIIFDIFFTRVDCKIWNRISYGILVGIQSKNIMER